MLKKIVKYGSSHALIFDKAILELLNLQEGSLVKIKTDGTSLILTPYKNLVEGHYVPADVNYEDSYMFATFEGQFKRNLKPNLTLEQKEAAYKRFKAAAIKYLEAFRHLSSNPEYQEAMKLLLEKYKDEPLSLESLEASKALRVKYEPMIVAIEDEFNAAIAVTPPPAINKEQFNMAQAEMVTVYKQFESVIKKLKTFETNPEFQRAMTLLAEQYPQRHNSQEYIDAVIAVNLRFVPEMKSFYDALELINQKYQL